MDKLQRKIHRAEKEKFAKSDGELRAMTMSYQKYYEGKYKLNPLALCEDFAEKMDKLALMEDNYNERNCWYIVVNPMPNIDEFEFFSACQRAMRKKWIINSQLWFEWRNEEGEGLHANFLIYDTSYPMCRVKGEFYNTFKEFIGDDKKMRDTWINVQNNRKDHVPAIMNYRLKEGKEFNAKLLAKRDWSLYYENLARPPKSKN